MKMLVGQSERHITLTNRAALTNLICIRFHSSKIRKISCSVESSGEDVRCGLHVIYVMHIQGATWTKMETRKLTLLSHSPTAKNVGKMETFTRRTSIKSSYITSCIV